MKVSHVLAELQAGMDESQNQRDKRVEELWTKLDPQHHGELDFKGLQKGLRRIDHPMQNADHMLKDIIKVVDTSGDGKIQYEEFRNFVETAERQLWLLFRSIDRDKDGRLDKNELRSAFQKAGLTVSNKRLSGFFDEVDMDHDGYISFDEWRDFLLFMPTTHNHEHGHEHGHHASTLEAALSFYSSIVTVNAEGDSLVSEETLEGLGTTGFLLNALFGSLLKIASPGATTTPTSQPPAPDSKSPLSSPSSHYPDGTAEPGAGANMAPSKLAPVGTATPEQVSADRAAHGQVIKEMEGEGQHDLRQESDTSLKDEEVVKSGLTGLLPDAGYFLAGAVSGGVSRTATAPLDRLKVFLLVNTKPKSTTTVVKSGQPLSALRNAGGPIYDAIRTLWRAGGIKTFFAGNGLNVVKIMPESAIRFGSYEASKRFLAAYEGHNDPSQISTVSKFVAGGMGGMTAQFCVYPIDTLKFRLQCETVEGGPKGHALLIRTAKNMWADGGLRAAYRGLGLGLIGMFPYSAIDIGTFEFLKKSYKRAKAKYYGVHEDDAAPGNVALGVLGASSGALGATVVYPLNVLRTRLQTQGTAMHPPTYTGFVDVATKTVRNEGIRGLYKGLTPNLLKVAPALSITWVCYENMKTILDLH
ncbi:mitochondrial carrier domain-containing protein [Neurospora hispaniola]|uniref:Mitochondrial thiamine pyrophosphate carrier 1 n=1 Tax=Neurospora hispaniola TaxID=588809 RepID=A0AAJ0MQJ4_9PEZI|nr:mitochondrial carrier domain-containing protein [Neurospora hispaniola]